MEETSVGLPNTCSQCGAPQAGTWFAASDDAARSGQGLCAACASGETEGATMQQEPIEPENGPVTEVPAGDAPREPDATPEAAELAASEGVELAHLRGTGKGGRILKSDVEMALAEREAGDA